MTRSFSDCFPGITGNIESCRRSPRPLVKKFHSHCSLINADDCDPIEQHAAVFFRSHKLSGDDVKDLAREELFGHLRSMLAMKEDLRKVRASAAGEYSVEGIEEFTVKSGLDKQGVSFMLHLLRDVSMAPVVWMFRSSSSPADPFLGLDRSSLPCRLGLESNSTKDYAFLEVRIPGEIQVKYSTAFDAGMNGRWRPGDVTNPNPECSGESGLPEVVARGRDFPGRSPGPGLTYVNAEAV